jgi:hypothetical protein
MVAHLSNCHIERNENGKKMRSQFKTKLAWVKAVIVVCKLV